MKNTFTFLLYILGCTCLSAQNLNFSDAKFKKLLLTSNSTNSIAIDENNNSIIIDENNDGEISLEEANRIKILNVRQDPNFKYEDPSNIFSQVNEEYYNEHLPEDIIDLLLFKNLEEIYVYDTKSVNLHFKDNDKLKKLKFFMNTPAVFTDRTVIFENCTAITDLKDVYIDAGPSIIKNRFSFINCPNVIPSDLLLRNFTSELTIVNTPIKSIKIEKVGASFSLNKLLINNIPTLKSVTISPNLGNELHLDLANNLNLEEILFLRDDFNSSPRQKIGFLNLEGNNNLKRIIGLNMTDVDLSNFGLINLEELDLSMYNRYKYYSSSGFIVFGDTKSINLKGLPKLKKLIAHNQSFDSIDLSDIPLLEEIDLTNTINLESLDLSNFNHLKNVKINLIYNSISSLGMYSPKLRNLKINNNSSLEKVTIENLSTILEHFELNNNENIADISFLKSSIFGSDNYLNKNTTFLIANNTKLNAINLNQHQFESLDLSKNKSLKNIFIHDNNIDMNLLNIRNNNTENVDLKQFRKFQINTICVNDGQVESMQTQFPESNIITTCNDKETLSINDLKKNNITIYPNPIQDNLTIKSSTEIKFIEIYSIAGEKVLYKTVNSKTYNISLVHLKPGNYILKINTNNEVQIKKIIKK